MPTTKELYGWKCLTLTSGEATLSIPTEIGPRVVSCVIDGGANLFHSVEAERGGAGEGEFMLRGGHRLWHAPEVKPRTYDPDNVAIKVSEMEEGKALQLEAPGPDPSGLQKTIQIAALGEETFKVTHRLRNTLQWAIHCAPWALTVMQRGGYATIPLLPKGEHSASLLPTYSLVPWSYTDFSCPAWQFRPDCIGIDTRLAEESQKVGLTNYPGWAAYWQEDGTFVKAASFDPRKNHPHNGAVFECFFNDFMIELETVGAMGPIAPGATVEHVEYWGVFAGLPKPDSDAIYNEEFRPVIEGWRGDLIAGQ